MALAPETWQRRLARGPLVLDGAMGTELERRGVATHVPLWSAAALIEQPEIVGAIHHEYVAAGADVLVANTFRTNPRTLARVGRLADGQRLATLAVALARQAAASAPGDPASTGVLVAASVGPVEDCYSPELVPADAVLRAEHLQMMAWLEMARPDLVWIETMNTVREAQAAGWAAAERHLPFAVSFVLREDGELLGGDRLEDAVAAVEVPDPLAIGVNCIPPRGLLTVLPRLRRATRRAVCAYAHVNNAVPTPGWSYSECLGPDEYGECASRWVAAGAQIIGGCCGTTPAHIRAVRARCSAGPSGSAA